MLTFLLFAAVGLTAAAVAESTRRAEREKTTRIVANALAEAAHHLGVSKVRKHHRKER